MLYLCEYCCIYFRKEKDCVEHEKTCCINKISKKEIEEFRDKEIERKSLDFLDEYIIEDDIKNKLLLL